MFDEMMLLEACGKAAGADARVCADEELFDSAIAIERARALLEVADAHVLAEIDARGASDTAFGLRTAAWVAWEAKRSRAGCKRQVKVANALRARLDLVEAALMEGSISFDHADVLTDAAANPRVGDAIVALQGELIAEAEAMVFERWRDHVRSLVVLLDQDGGYDPNDDPATNRLTYAKTLDGVTHAKFTLTGIAAETTFQTLNAIADELYDHYVRDAKTCDDIAIPPRSQLLAEAMVEMARRANAVDRDSTTPPAPEVTLVVKADDPDTIYDPNGGVILQDGRHHHLHCDHDTYAIIINHLGQPLDMSRRIRSANRAQRRAAAARDGGCVFRGCDITALSWLDMHHIEPWNHHGPTNIANLAGLCRHHHNITHRTGWHTFMHHDGWIWFQTPTGQSFWGQQHGKQRQDPTPNTT